MRFSRDAAILALTIACAAGAPAWADDHTVTLTPLYQFPAVGDGEAPWCNLVSVNKVLYGTTFEGGAFGRGAVFSVSPTTGAEKLLYSFQNAQDATNPQAGLTAVGKLLYGVSNTGGANGLGAVYSIDPTSGAEQVIFSLTPAMGGGSGSNLVASGNNIYGTTYSGSSTNQFGVIFSVNLKTNAGSIIYAFTGGADGAGPQTGITLLNGEIYGTATSGGSSGAGTLFAVDVATGAETTLHSFTGGSDGGNPDGGVIDVSGVLYGTASYGGSNSAGVVFAYNLASSTETTLHNFTGGSDGASPLGSLLAISGTLYGTANTGGSTGNGTVFGINIASGKETTLSSFPGGNGGAHPQTGLIAVGKDLYGTDAELNVPGISDGTVFGIVTATGATTVLHDFQGNVNQSSNSALVDVGGTFYGTAQGSAASPYGSIYKFDPATGTQTTLYSFTGAGDGGGPAGGVTAVGKVLYGVARLGGNNFTGGIFSFNTTTSKEALAASFPTMVSAPTGPLAYESKRLYGVTGTVTGSGTGTIFEFDPAGASITTVYNFGTIANDGYLPIGGLTASGGVLYGATEAGGSNYGGTVYSFAPATGTETILHSFAGTDGLYPSSLPVLANGTLYGGTSFGGSSTCYGTTGCGVLYSVTTSGGNFSVLHSFTYTADGAQAGPLLVDGSVIYGGTFAGGSSGAGTLFSYDTSTTGFTTLYDFTGNQDGNGAAFLTRISKTIYGVSVSDGTYGQGTLFSFTGF
jgi:uncharacterized repeat protein (TIGR03803 family)